MSIRARCFVSLLVAASLAGGVGAQQSSSGAATTSEAEPWPDPEVIAERKRVAEGRPLFAASEPLAFTLLADFRAVQRDRNPESTRTYPATLVVAGQDGTEASIPMRIRTR